MLKKILTFKIAIILGGIIIVMVMTIGIIAAIAGISIGYEKVKREAEMYHLKGWFFIFRENIMY